MYMLPPLVVFLRKWLLIDAILIEDFEKVQNDVIIAINCLQTVGVFPKLSELR